MPTLDEQEFKPLTESHRISSRIQNYITTDYLAIFGASILCYVFILFAFNNVFMHKHDKENLHKIHEYRQQVDQMEMNRQISNEKAGQYLTYLNKKESQIKSKYPPILFITDVFRTKLNRIIAFILYFIPLFTAIGTIFYFRKDFKEKSKFFYQVAKKEDPLSLPREIQIRMFVGRDIYKEQLPVIFSDLDTILRIFQTVIKSDDEKIISEKISEKMVIIYRFLNKYYKELLSNDNLLRIEFILWHYCASFYGNIPTGLIGRLIKDYTLRKMLSHYSQGYLPVVFDVVQSRFIERDYDSYLLLNVLYTTDRFYNILSDLKKTLDPLPF